MTPRKAKTRAAAAAPDTLYEALAGKMVRDTTENLGTIARALAESPAKLRAELLAATRALDVAQRKLDDVNELAAEMASALRLADLSGNPVKPWQFKNCAQRLRCILTSDKAGKPPRRGRK